MKKVLKFGCLGVVGFVVLIGVLGALLGKGSGSSTATTTGQRSAAVAASTNEQSAPTMLTAPATAPAPTPLPAVGQDVQVDEVRWKILSAEDLGNTLKSDNQFVKDRTTSGRFVKVRFELENLSKDMLSFAGLDLIDNQERVFTRSSDALQFISSEESCVIENLNPNVAKTCTAIYEIPAAAAGLKAQVGDLKLLGNASALIDLGLEKQ